MLLLPTPVPLASVDSSLLDLSREGPFDAHCVPADTGSHPLISDGLPSCPYCRTSYREEDVAEVHWGTRVSPVIGLFPVEAVEVISCSGIGPHHGIR